MPVLNVVVDGVGGGEGSSVCTLPLPPADPVEEVLPFHGDTTVSWDVPVVSISWTISPRVWVSLERSFCRTTIVARVNDV